MAADPANIDPATAQNTPSQTYVHANNGAANNGANAGGVPYESLSSPTYSPYTSDVSKPGTYADRGVDVNDYPPTEKSLGNDSSPSMRRGKSRGGSTAGEERDDHTDARYRHQSVDHNGDDEGDTETLQDTAKLPKRRVNWGKIGITPHIMKFGAELVAEFIGTFFMILVGDSASGMALLEQPSPYLTAYWGVAITWGLAVSFAIFGVGGVSGAHLNPTVTLSFTIFRGFPKWKVIPYMIAQTMGCMIGAYAMYSQWHTEFAAFYAANPGTVYNQISPTSVQAAKTWFTAMNKTRDAMDEFIGQIYQTGILLFGVFAITDPYNPNSFSHNGMSALLIGYVVAMIGAAFGFLEGFPINPARDLGPRLAAYSLGWGEVAFPGFNHSYWPPLAGPFVGALLGAFIYEAFSRPFMPGVVKHGYTPFMLAWNDLLLRIAPSLQADDEEEAEDEQDVKRQQRHHIRPEMWSPYNVGPGTRELQRGGLSGLDLTSDR